MSDHNQPIAAIIIRDQPKATAVPQQGSPKKRKLESEPFDAAETQFLVELQLKRDASKVFVKGDREKNRAIARAKAKYLLNVQVDLIVVPAALLRSSSSFFSTAMNEEHWARRDEDTGVLTVHLPDSDYFHVSYFMSWLQGAKLGGHLLPVPATGIEEAELLIELYKYGEEIMSERFKNAVVDAVRVAFANPHLTMSSTTLEEAFQHLPEGCGLQRFFVDFTIERMPTPAYDEDMNRHAGELMIRVARAMRDDRHYGIVSRAA
ncbi:Hypothetical protein D9617_8g050630 [Elsinoe fawcettii]|nr:Hypothetical protein D9617_8g050630 [Elsinoe fawcettii]